MNHPEYDLSVAEMQEHEQPHLMPMVTPPLRRLRGRARTRFQHLPGEPGTQPLFGAVKDRPQSHPDRRPSRSENRPRIRNARARRHELHRTANRRAGGRQDGGSCATQALSVQLAASDYPTHLKAHHDRRLWWLHRPVDDLNLATWRLHERQKAKSPLRRMG